MIPAAIEITPRQTAKFLGFGVIVVVGAHLAVLVARFAFGHGRLLGLAPLFDLDHEGNIPTLFSTALLLLCALLLVLIAANRRRQHLKAGLWFLLSGIFVFLAIDEFAALHERLARPVRTYLGVSGTLFYAWVIPYGFFLAVLVLVYTRFVFEMPSRPRRLIIISLLVFLSGALGFEMIGAGYFSAHNMEIDIVYALLTTFEEVLEMVGLVFFVYALLLYIEQGQHGITIKLGVSPARNS